MTARDVPSVWDEIARFRLPLVFLHQHSGQPDACLEGLVMYAVLIAKNKHTYSFRSPYQILAWLWQQSVDLDIGVGPKSPGCIPAQRSRIWPDNGLNCWEAVAHLLAVGFANQWMLEFHIYDAKVGIQRHVFPAIRPLNAYNDLPVPLVIQPPVKTGKGGKALRYAQAAGNDILGGIHIVGDKVLRVFGADFLADSMAQLEGDALPDWARTAKQREQRAAEQIKLAVAQNPKSSEEKNATTSYTQDLESLKREMELLKRENASLLARLERSKA